LTNGACGEAYSTDALVSVEALPVITTDLTNQSACVGAMVTWSVVAHRQRTELSMAAGWNQSARGRWELHRHHHRNAGLTARWRRRMLWTRPGGMSCRVSGSCTLTAWSSKVALMVEAASVGGTATAGSPAICSGSGVTVSLAGHTGAIVKWASSTDAGANVVGPGFGPTIRSRC